MTYLLGGAMTEYPTWRNFFDVVIVAATKPIFFTEKRPLLERDGETVRPASAPLAGNGKFAARMSSNGQLLARARITLREKAAHLAGLLDRGANCVGGSR